MGTYKNRVETVHERKLPLKLQINILLVSCQELAP